MNYYEVELEIYIFFNFNNVIINDFRNVQKLALRIYFKVQGLFL